MRAGQRIMHVSGRLVYDTKHRFTDLVRKETAPIVILDLSDLVHVDSYGVGALVMIQASFKLEKQRLALVGLNEKVRHVLEITQVLRVFTVFETVAAAEEALVWTANEF